ncbi:MepB family protein [Pedobacter sp. V48]|uniref:MepB family protein n=1 Tax=Pedobacter sp. V48 TaxID=509635 RepID=UPI0003E5A151|nr:MepB family protein [Pedobacter sp. V48]ETZ23703.1 hypothetical protein N824_19810 [Pedobacter sp. V48]
MEEHTTSKIFHEDFYEAEKEVYAKYGSELRELSARENADYGARNFKLPGKTIEFRVSKITPKKVGQFVAIWRRNEQGVTQPFEETDEIDFMVIGSRTVHNFGLFVFPKSILIDQGIISSNKEAGKRGIRVYPPWDKPTNKQAQKTQSWQIKYFISIDPN